MTSRLPLGQILMQQGRLDQYQLLSALAHQQRWGGRIGEAIAALGFVPETEVLATVARQLGVPFVRVGDQLVAPAVLRRVPEKLVRARKVFPLAILSGSRRGPLVVATNDPQNLYALDEVAFASGLSVKAALAGAADVERAIERHYGNGRPSWGESAVELPPAALAPMRVIPFAERVH